MYDGGLEEVAVDMVSGICIVLIGGQGDFTRNCWRISLKLVLVFCCTLY